MSDGVTRWSYGMDPAQIALLTRPAGTPHRGVVVLIHGGFWKNEYDLTLAAPLAADLAARGYVSWTIEYRRVGGGGGWPATFDDVAAAIDLLDAVPDLDRSRVVAVGHSAGGHLAVWAAGRPRLDHAAPGADPVVPLTGAISQAGVLDLGAAADALLGGGATQQLLGGSPGDVPDRFALADPIRRVPIGVPVVAVHSRADEIVPFAQSERYVATARSAGDEATLIEVTGDHFAVIDPESTAWAATVPALDALMR